ncbi:hypothetical protein F4604DRAFT_1915249 [Suillus subluteus]|nr:hypothetical protein F4604DRAFT_1915249 [Suillus subluteus]
MSTASTILSSESDYNATDIPSDVSPRAQTLQSDAEKPSWYLRLPNISNKSRAARLITTALAAVYSNNIPVDDSWDDNDNSLVESVAKGIDVGRFDIETV